MTDKAISPAAAVMAAERAAIKDLRSIVEKATEAALAHVETDELLPSGLSQARGAAMELYATLQQFTNSRLASAESAIAAK